LSELNNDPPGLDQLLKYKKSLRKLRKETRDPECKTEVNRVPKSIRRMTQEEAFERWETTLANTEATPQAIWPIGKSPINRDGPRAPTDVHGHRGITFHALEKANATAYCLEKHFTAHDLWEEKHEQRVEGRIQALLEAVDSNPTERIRPRELQK
jgi:hypothetical protein